MGIRRTSGADYDLSNPVESFADVVRRVVLQPVGFFRGLPRRGSLLNPLVFALICTEIAAILGGILSLAGVGGAFVTGYGFQVPENQGLGEFIGSVVFAPIGGAIGVFVVAGIAIAIALSADSSDPNPKLQMGLIFGVIAVFLVGLFIFPVSYTHLTLPTKRIV